MRRTLLLLIAAGALAAAAPASANVDVSFSAGAGVVLHPEENNGWRVIVEHFADGSRNGFRVRQTAFGDPTITGGQSGCTTNPFANDVVCDGVVPTLVQMDQADDDQNVLVVGGSNVGCEPGPPVRVILKLGAGDDTARPSFGCGGQDNVSGNNRLSPVFTGGAGDGNDLLIGGRLDDAMNGDAGNDQLSGGVGPDVLTGGTGNDLILGQGGDDDLTGDSGADTLDGGGGADTVRYPILNRVIVTLDGAANDGRVDEGDNVKDVETVIGGEGGDTLTGSSAPETLDGGPGDDTLEPGGGSDTARGSDGDDLIDVREGVEDRVTCGGGSDEVIADLVDVVQVRLFHTRKDLSECERVERFAVDDGPPGRIGARSVRLRGRTVSLRLACPARARVSCRGRLRAADPRRLGRTLGRASYSVPRRGSGRIRLQLSRAGARRARRVGAITVITRERGVSKKGPRSTTATLRVR